SGRRRKPSWRRREQGVRSTEYAVLGTEYSGSIGGELGAAEYWLVGLKNVQEISNAFGPLNRTMARPPRPGADERATIVSWMSAIMRVVRQRLLDSGKRAEFSGIIQRARNEKS